MDLGKKGEREGESREAESLLLNFARSMKKPRL